MMRIMGSQKCEECNGAGDISYGERHGQDARDACPACHGRGIVPKYKFYDDEKRRAHPS